MRGARPTAKGCRPVTGGAARRRARAPPRSRGAAPRLRRTPPSLRAGGPPGRRASRARRRPSVERRRSRRRTTRHRCTRRSRARVSRSGGTGITCSCPGGPARIVPPSVPSAIVYTGIPADWARSAPCPGLQDPRVWAPSERRRIEASDRPFASLSGAAEVLRPSPDRPVAARASSTARAIPSPSAVPNPGPSTSIPWSSCLRSTVGETTTWASSENETIPIRSDGARGRGTTASRSSRRRAAWVHVGGPHGAGGVDDQHDARPFVRRLHGHRRPGERDAERRERGEQERRGNMAPPGTAPPATPARTSRFVKRTAYAAGVAAGASSRPRRAARAAASRGAPAPRSSSRPP